MDSAQAAGPLVDVGALTHVYRPTTAAPVMAVRELYLQLMPGERMALTGRSGSGKTTVLNILAGLLVPTRGRVRVGPYDLLRLTRHERDEFRRTAVGYVWQQPEDGLWPDLTALENVLMPTAGAESARDRQEHALRLLDELRLTGLGHLRPAQLTGADRRRLAVAVALANRPALLLADDPTAELDERTGDELLGDLAAHARRLGVAVVVAAHAQDALRHVDRVVQLPGEEAILGSGV
jgi:ABC-type lipoprotein export system ATPase subunit